MIDVVLDNTNIEKIYNSGQCFGISRNPYNLLEFWCVSGSRFCRVVKDSGFKSILTCFDEDKDYWWNYFDMDTDYDSISDKYVSIDDSDLSRDIVNLSKGLRMLNQEFPDCLVSFITSQRKSVPAIRTAIDGLCRAYGETSSLENYFGSQYKDFGILTFPSSNVYNDISIEMLESLGFGYRASYVVEAFRALKDDRVNEDTLKELGYLGAKSRLLSLYGVGEKIANCVLLYSLGYRGAYPRDVWIYRFEEQYCNGRFPDEEYEGIAGIIQLWQYYFMLNSR